MDAIHELLTRGVDQIYPSKEELEQVLRSGKKLRLYQGFDPTGTQLHIGHMVGLRKHRQWQDLGHEVIFLVGDGTGQAGDPTGKKQTRERFYTRDELRANAKDYLSQAAKVVRFTGPHPVKVLFNSDWLNQLRLTDILDIAQHFTVQQLIERDMFQDRLRRSEPINLREFLYPLLQGYDSVAMDVDLEMGGTDQTFNMLAGRMLMRSMKGKDKFVMTTPLLADADGVKIGKSEGNVIALTDQPADLFGKIMSLGDASIVPMLTLLTDTPPDRIASISADIAAGTNPMDFKKLAAHTIVAQLNSQAAADSAQKAFESVFQRGSTPTDIPTHTFASTPTISQVLVQSGLVSSNSEARRIVDQRGTAIDGQKVNEYNQSVPSGATVSVGPRKFVKVVVGK